VNCDARHGRFYQRYGFYKVENGEEYHVKERNANESSLQVLETAESLRTSPVAQEYYETIESMVEEFNTTNEITRMI
ncbi:MAG: hypothetical protein ABJN28_00400, partial [Flavobacteriaceae bacterium]